jgi:hypothetical protein
MSDDTFKPTQKIAANAKRGLKLREKFGRGGTDVGVARAHQLVGQHELSAEDVRSMHSYFARHAVDKNAKTHQWDSDDDPSAGFIAWLLWGGDEGEDWAAKKTELLREG